jgi:phosphate ABC transporter permease protein PstC
MAAIDSTPDVAPPSTPVHLSAGRSEVAARIVFGGLAAVSLIVVVAITIFVLHEGWPSFKANGLAWFTDSKLSLDTQLSSAFAKGTTYLRAWPAILGTLLTTIGALLVAFPFAVLASIFIAELSPRWLTRVIEPVVALLAATPSVIYGLFAILVVAPWINSHLIDPNVASDYSPIVTLTGANVLLGIFVLAVMIAPVMIAIFVDALRAVPVAWSEGAIALGCDRWRAARRVSLVAIRPALVAGTCLAIGRAIGEAIALSMATGSIAFTPNVLDGLYFFLEPVRTLASSIVDYSEGFDQPVLRADLFAFGAVLLVTTAIMTLAGRGIAAMVARRSMGGA